MQENDSESPCCIAKFSRSVLATILHTNEGSMFPSSSYDSVRLLKIKKPNLDFSISTLGFLDTIQPPPTVQVHMCSIYNEKALTSIYN